MNVQKTFIHSLGEIPQHLVPYIRGSPVPLEVSLQVAYYIGDNYGLNPKPNIEREDRVLIEELTTKGYDELKRKAIGSGFDAIFRVNPMRKKTWHTYEERQGTDNRYNYRHLEVRVECLAYHLEFSE